MRKAFLAGTIAAGLFVAVGALSLDRAQAMALSVPTGVRAALPEAEMAALVHCVPGVVHRHGRVVGTGCAVVRPRAVVVAPRRVVPRARVYVRPHPRRF
jgi:hypothetical protein